MQLVGNMTSSRRAAFLVFAALLVSCFLLGGSSRADAQSQMFVRAAAVLAAAVAVFFMDRQALNRVRFPITLLSMIALTMVIQIIPLSPKIWTLLPGREVFANAASIVGIDQPWRPISQVPDATLNSILALLPALAAALCFSLLDRDDYFFMLMLLLLLCVTSGFIGIVQISDGKSLYFYRLTNNGSSVGLFANRNHQAVLLAMILPSLAAFALYPTARVTEERRAFVAILLGLLVLPMLIVTGSRAGLLLLAVGIVGAGMLWTRSRVRVNHDQGSPIRKSLGKISPRNAMLMVGVAAAVIIVAGLIAFAKAIALQRLFSMDIEADARLVLFWPMIDILKTFFPFGSGFGTFPNVFKVFEPAFNLGPSYFNHAHNDILEVLIEGGAFSLVLMLAFSIWWINAARRLWAPSAGSRRGIIIGRLGSVFVVMLVLASSSDYPLRTPIGSLVFLLSCCWMSVGLRDIADLRQAEHGAQPIGNAARASTTASALA